MVAGGGAARPPEDAASVSSAFSKMPSSPIEARGDATIGGAIGGAIGDNRLPPKRIVIGETGSDTKNAKQPSGRSGFWCLTPFRHQPPKQMLTLH